MIWYEDEIKQLEKKRAALIQQPETLFYGSSSIRLWSNLGEDFKDFAPANLGFGGSTLAACTWFFDRVMEGYQPKRLVLYAGDNDLGDGRHPEEVFIFFKQFAANVAKRFGGIPCYYISLKPSIARSALLGQFKYTNDLIAGEIENNHTNWHWIDIFNPMLGPNGQPGHEYYTTDGLHMNEKGYAIWENAIKKAFSIYN